MTIIWVLGPEAAAVRPILITEGKRLVEAMKRETDYTNDREFLLCMINKMTDLVRVTDGQYNLLLENEAMREWRAGRECHRCFEAIGRNEPCENCISNMAIKLNRVFSKEICMDGKIYAVDSIPIPEAGNRPRAAMEIIRDITEYKRLYAELQAKNYRLEKKLEMAHSMQKALIPQASTYGEYAFSTLFRSCETLGGDMMDIIELPHNELAFYIADISGHGVPAGMMTMMLHQMVRIHAKELSYGHTLGHFMGAMQKSFNAMALDGDKYITMVLGVLEPKTGMVTLLNAGHNMLPAHISHDGTITEIELHGMPISKWDKGEKYDEHILHLEHGDSLLLYTDGLARGGREEFAGITKILSGVKSDSILRVLEEEIDGQPNDDDTAALLLQRNCL